jgi:hypothetical protein
MVYELKTNMKNITSNPNIAPPRGNIKEERNRNLYSAFIIGVLCQLIIFYSIFFR